MLVRNKELFSTNWMKPIGHKRPCKGIIYIDIYIYNYEILMHQSLVPKIVLGHFIVEKGHQQCLKTGT